MFLFGGDCINCYVVKNVFRSDNRIEGFTENHLLLLVGLQEYTTYRNKIYFNFGLLFERLNITYHQLKKELYNCIVDLNDWGLINILNMESLTSINQNTNIILDSISYDSSFTILNTTEVDKIIYTKYDIRTRRSMLYVYTIIASWIGINGRKYCFPRIEDLKLDLQTKSNYKVNNLIKQLKDIGVIDYANAGFVKDDEGIRKSNNVYVLTNMENYELVLQNAIVESKYYYSII